MHWSTLRALDTIAKQGHARLDLELLDALSRDETTRTEVEGLRAPRLPSSRQRRRALPSPRPAPQRELVDGS